MHSILLKLSFIPKLPIGKTPNFSKMVSEILYLSSFRRQRPLNKKSHLFQLTRYCSLFIYQKTLIFDQCTYNFNSSIPRSCYQSISLEPIPIAGYDFPGMFLSRDCYWPLVAPDIPDLYQSIPGTGRQCFRGHRVPCYIVKNVIIPSGFE